MVSESELVNLDNAPLRFFDLSVMTVAEKLTLKKKLKVELSYVISAAESIEEQLSRMLSCKISVAADDCQLLSGNDYSANMQSSSGGTEGHHVSSRFKRKATDMCAEHIVTDGFSNRKEMMIMEKSESASVVTGTRKCENLPKLDGEKSEGHKIDASKFKQCMLVLSGLMNHRSGWVFNKPVDPVNLNIPDYFSIISNPMDLGTIRTRLKNKLYLDTLDFAADVKLTFSNAMRYNPPYNDVHVMAKELNNIFSKKWKILEVKWRKERPHASQQSVPRKVQIGTPTSIPVIREESTCDQISSAKKLLTSADRQMLRKKLAKISQGNTPAQVLRFLERFGFHGQNDGSIEVDIDEFDEEALLELHQLVRSCMDQSLSKSEGPKKGCEEVSVQGLHEGNASRNVSRPWHDSQRPRISSCTNSTSNNIDRLCSSDNDFTQSSSSDVDSERSSGGKNQELPVIASHLTRDDVQKGNLNRDSDVANLFNGENAQTSCTPTTPPSYDKKGEGHPVSEEQLSPSKALRAAMLKRRFADTILKAQQKTLLNNGGKGDPAKMKQERENLKKKQQEERARIEAQVKAAEAAARKKVDEELKLQREREREAARLALQKMEKTVDIDENREIQKDLEILGYSQPNQHIDLPNEMVVDFTDGFELQGGLGNPLEQLGLFIKKDDLDEEAEDWISASGICDVEEGEIGPT
uniref:Transcription factor GTE9 n=1 Tax=Anthurium amnicola TaxID=1678845 RepID=A0A1D1YFC0_9ARAE